MDDSNFLAEVPMNFVLKYVELVSVLGQKITSSSTLLEVVTKNLTITKDCHRNKPNRTKDKMFLWNE